MNPLQNAGTRLESLFSPSADFSNATVIWEVGDDDPRAKMKRALIAAATDVLAAGKQALHGGRPSGVSFGDVKFEMIARSLAGDAEQRDFLELAAASETVASLLSSLPNTNRDTS